MKIPTVKKLDDVLDQIHSETVLKPEQPTPEKERSVVLSLHYTQVGKKVKSIKEDGDTILMKDDASPFTSEKGNGWVTVLWHGLTKAADKKTFIRTYNDGRAESWTEPLTV
jgi:hypothetical protein